MKKLILSLSVIVLAIMTVNAQVSVGVKAGLNLATWTGADATSTNLPGKKTKAGLNVGGIVNIHIHNNFSVQPEAYLSMEGVKVDGGSYELTYINIPVLAKYKFSGSHFSVATGPQFGLLTSAQVKATGGAKTDIKDLLNSYDLAWAVAVSYLTRRNFGFDARYNIGVTTIDKGTPKDKFTNSVFQLDLFYMFGKKKGKK